MVAYQILFTVAIFTVATCMNHVICTNGTYCDLFTLSQYYSFFCDVLEIPYGFKQSLLRLKQRPMPYKLCNLYVLRHK